MTDRHDPARPDIRRLDRRRFLAMLGSAGALGAVGCSARVTHTPVDAGGVAAASSPAAAVSPAISSDRILVVVELAGGNDGLAMLRPTDARGDGVLRSQRPMLLGDDDTTSWIAAGDDFAWTPSLSRLTGRGLAGIVGIGSEAPDFSHFEMEQRWWRGDSGERSRLTTGFFGRLCDQLDVGAPVTGLSLAGGPTPALLSEKAVTVGFTDPGANWMFRESNPWLDTFHETVRAMSEPSASDHGSMTMARDGLLNTSRFAESVGAIDESDDYETYPWTDLGQQLRFGAEILQADVGVRILHTQIGGFDTHAEQAWRHPELMSEIDEAVSVFLDDLDQRGLAGSTLVVTTSEFGRRVPQNDGGTDHGGASTMLLCGPGTTGIHGEAPDLSTLDDGNVIATARFEDYYATIAEGWFGVPAGDVLPSGGEVIDGVLPGV